MRRSLLILLVFALLQRCISPYDFESIGSARTLVIDASLTNETTAHAVRLSYSFEIDTSQTDPVAGASVAFIDGANNRTVLRERSAGLYLTDSSFAGIPGTAYTLEVSLANGNTYRSTPEVLPAAIPIDSIYGEYLRLPNANDERNQTGVQIFVDAHAEDGEPKSFRYTYRDSYETPVPYPSRYDWTGRRSTFEIIEREKPLGPCYRKSQSTTTLVATTSGLSENRIVAYPIRFINQSAQELAYKYIIEVTQYTISQDAHAFFRYLQESNEGAGSLSDRQLGSINGNITNVDDPQELVLGYFETAGVSRAKRIFSYHEFLDDGIITEEYICLTPDNPEEFGFGCEYFDQRSFQIFFREQELIYDVRTGDSVLIDVEYYDLSGLDAVLNDSAFGPGELCGYTNRIVDIPPPGDFALIAHELCSDCTLYGSLERPEVWDD